jgi:hypothetical protein
MKATKLSWTEFIKQFDTLILDADTLSEARKKPGIVGIACLENHVMDSSWFGQKTALVYGPVCTFKSVEQMEEQSGGVYITGLPSSASFPINYTEDLPS